MDSPNFGFLACRGFAVSIPVAPRRNDEAIEHVSRQILLQIILAVVLQDLAHVANRHLGQVGVTDDRVSHPHRQTHTAGFGVERLAYGLEVLAEQIGREALFVNGRIQQHIRGQNVAFAFALQVHRFGCPTAQIHRDHLIPLLAGTVKEWQCHSRFFLYFDPELSRTGTAYRTSRTIDSNLWATLRGICS